MRTRILIFLATAVMMAMLAMPAAASSVDSATAHTDCVGFTLTLNLSGIDAPDTVQWEIVVSPLPGTNIVINGSEPVSLNQTVATITRTWASYGVTLNGPYSFAGTAFINGQGSSTYIIFMPTTLSCSPPPPGPHLTIVKSPKNGTFPQGSQVSFSMVVGNDGASDATNVHLHDQLPSNGGLVFTGYQTSQGVCFLSVTNLLDCDLGTLAPGASATITVFSSNITPLAACQLQPNPHAVATADGGLIAEDSGSMSCTPPPLPCPGGSFTFSYDAAGNLNIVFDQFPAPNDNSYGVNAVGWQNGHTFNNLVGSDHAGFQLVDPNGVVKLSFNIDYISADTTAPSGYKSLGPFGGDGKVLVGTLTPADIMFTSSLANNLNNINIPGLFNAAHVQQFGSVNVLVNSPPTDPAHQTYTNSDPALAGWDFHDTYFVQISAAKLAAIGFNSSWMVEPNLDALHNSPAKACPAPSGGASLAVTKTEVKDKQVKVTVLNSGSVDEFVTGVQATWPASNGNLVQVKLDGDVIYDNPDIPPPSANLTLANLVADPNKRKIQHGSSDVLTLIFANNADPNLGNYSGTLSTSGFVLTILP